MSERRMPYAKMDDVRGPGARLAENFCALEVRPLLGRALPGLAYLAGRLGPGSDVLGLDDERSIDHDFGCRLTLLVDTSAADVVAVIDDLLERELPETFADRPVRFATSWDDRHHHKVEVQTVHNFARSRLGIDTTAEMEAVDWLTVTGQSILEVMGGAIFHDTTREYRSLKKRLRWYPDDVWLYVLAAGWARLSQELPFIGRTGERGDEVGFRIIAARLARDLVHLTFLLERRWPPYPKWAGIALRALGTGLGVIERLEAASVAQDWKSREHHLGEAIELLAARQLALGLPSAVPALQPLFDRPFQIVNPLVPQTLVNAINDQWLRALPAGIGSIEQWCDNVDLLAHPGRRPAARQLYRDLVASGSQ